ncbi:MAG: DUF3592 domain-containing protein [Mucilaginibacter sp.]|uniref:DUF3592 domain-containing protein n=1 Tax=Mucilaginibacter sp. TaxID=1882438 RepID=UPI0031B1329E
MNITINEWITLTIGLFIIVWGIGKINERRKLLRTGIRVEGVVFKLEKRIGGGKNRMPIYYPVIRYVTQDKEWITKEYGSGTNPSVYKEGDMVKIIYDPADNGHFIIDGFLNRVSGFVLLAAGVLAIAGVIVYYILMR